MKKSDEENNPPEEWIQRNASELIQEMLEAQKLREEGN